MLPIVDNCTGNGKFIRVPTSDTDTAASKIIRVGLAMGNDRGVECLTLSAAAAEVQLVTSLTWRVI